MVVDSDKYLKVNGKVLLYTSRDKGASPAMTITHDTVDKLPPVLQKLARIYSPIRSKLVHNTHGTWFKCTVQIQTVAYMSLKTICGLLKADSHKPSWTMILYHGMHLLMVNLLFHSLL